MHLKDLGTSLKATKDIQNVLKSMSTFDGANITKETTNRLKNVAKQYNTEVLKLASSQVTLTRAQAKAIFQAKGLSGAELEAAVSTATLSTTQAGATVSTASLSAAYQGLAASIGVSTTALSIMLGAAVAIGGLAFGIYKYNQHIKEQNDNAREAAKAINEENKSLDGNIAKIKELRARLDDSNTSESEAYNIKSQLYEIQQSLVDTYGSEAEGLRLVNGEIDDQVSKLKILSKEKALAWQKEHTKAIERANTAMTQELPIYVASATNLYSDKDHEQLDAIQKAVDKYASEGLSIDITPDVNFPGALRYEIIFTGNPIQAKEVLDDFSSDIQGLANEFGDENNYILNNLIIESVHQLNRQGKIINDNIDSYVENLKANIAQADAFHFNKTNYDPNTLYDDYLTAIDKYNKALFTGDGIDEAKKKYEELLPIITEFINQHKEFTYLFNDENAGLNTKAVKRQEFIDNFSTSDYRNKAETLRGMRDVDLKTSNVTDSQQDAFDWLTESAEGYNLTLNDTLDILEELGFIYGKVFTDSLNQNPFEKWKETLGVFDQAEAKMNALAELNGKLSGSYTMTAGEARKYSEIFPELLAQGQVTSDGLIQFNQAYIEDFISGKQLEIQADTNSQLQQLKNQKALLEGKLETAKVVLALIQAQGNEEINAENQKNTALAEAKDNFVQHLADLGVEEANIDSTMKELMAGNTQEYDRITAEVSDNIATNLAGSSQEAAVNVSQQSGDMIGALYSVGEQAYNTGKSIESIGSENPSLPEKSQLSGRKGLLKIFEPKTIVSNFKKALPEEIKIKRYVKTDLEVKLEEQIPDLQKSLDSVNSQIALLEAENSQPLKDLLPDSGSSSGGSRGSSKQNEVYEELNGIDRMLELSKRRLSDYNNELEDALTVQDKDAAIGKIIQENEFQLSKQWEIFSFYSQKAKEVLAQIPEEMHEKVKEGVMDIEKLNDQNLSSLIKQYHSLDQAAYEANSQTRALGRSIDDMKKKRIEIQIEGLERSKSTWERLKSQYESAISAVTSSIQSEIDSVNDYYDAQKKHIQDQIDALDEQNDKLEMQKRLEQALYDIRRAERQRTNRVYREGLGFVYEADQDAVRDARQAYDEAQFEKTKYDLQQILDGLEKEREDEVEYLTEIMDAWNQIAESFERMADSKIADDILGVGWLEDILSGDTSLFDEMTENFGDVFTQIADSEDAIQSLNELLEQVESGEMSEDNALAVMNEQLSALGENTTTQAGIMGEGYHSIYSSAENAKNLSAETYTAWTENLALFQEQSLAVCNSLAAQFNAMADAVAEAVKRAKEAKKELEEDDGGDSGSESYSSSKAPIHSGSSTGGINASIHHRGILSGTFGSSTEDERVKALKHLSTDKLKPEEVPLIGLKDEIALTKEQQDTLLSNVRAVSFPTYSIPGLDFGNVPSAKPEVQNNEYNFSGGIHITEAQNVTDIANGISEGMLKQALRQELYKR